MMKSFATVTTLLLLAALTGCATHTVKTTTYTPVIQSTENIPEELLLDVGISLFDPGLDELADEDEEVTNGQIRVAESRYAPYLLASTLQRSGNWGIVRLLPNDASPMDVQIDGTILRSNGEEMVVRVDVSDSTGRHWYTREYEEVISQFSYDPAQRQQNDPFQVLYNNIANDLLAYRQRNVSAQRVRAIRTVSEMLFPYCIFLGYGLRRSFRRCVYIDRLWFGVHSKIAEGVPWQDFIN